MDIYSSNWDPTDANNDDAAPDGAPEGMAPGGINDVLRAHQGAIKRYVNQQSPKTTAGSSTAFTLTYSVAPGALYDGATHLVEFDQANGAAATGLQPLTCRIFAVALWQARMTWGEAPPAALPLRVPDSMVRPSARPAASKSSPPWTRRI